MNTQASELYQKCQKLSKERKKMSDDIETEYDFEIKYSKKIIESFKHFDGHREIYGNSEEHRLEAEKFAEWARRKGFEADIFVFQDKSRDVFLRFKKK